tara:strand:+ start:1165 stop:1560 length:396 start_codon:yes stop_codon:yes gene_type:complete
VRAITLPTEYEEAKKMFGIFYSAAFGGAGAKDAAGARKLMKLQDELEAIATEEVVPEKELPNGVDEDTRWVLNRRVKELKLEDAHWSLLKGRIYSDDIRWAASVTRQVLAAFDALEEAEEIKPAKKAAKEK